MRTRDEEGTASETRASEFRKLSPLIPLALAFSIAGAAHAETLPLRVYDVPEGLSNSRITAILQARRGDLWVATWDGISRFDGYEFTNFNTHDGLPGSLVSAIAEDRGGGLWFGTFNSGLARLIDDPAKRAAPGKKFATYHVAAADGADSIGAVAVDAKNRLWCATRAGIYRADLDAGEPVFVAVLPGVDVSWPQLFAVEPRGRVFAGDGLTTVWEIGDGAPVRHSLPRESSGDMWNVVLANEGGLWVSTGDQLWRFTPKGPGIPEDVWRRAPLNLGPDNYVRMVAEDGEGTLWVATYRGLIRWRNGSAMPFTTEQGLPDDKIRTLTIDRDGNLWIGTHNGGLAKLPRGGLVNFTTADGLTDRNVLFVVESMDRHIYAATDRAGVVEIENGRAHRLPGSDAASMRNICLAQDKHGDWWIGIGTGLYFTEGPELRFDRLRHLTTADGIPDPDTLVMGVFRDRDGSVVLGQGPRMLTEITPREGERPAVVTVPLPSPPAEWLARRVLRDRAGTLWVSSYNYLGRLKDGAIASLSNSPGLPDTQVRTLLQDKRGRVWLGHRNLGLSMTDQPEARTPRFANWTVQDGLSSDTVWALGEDDAGRIYVGTARGLDRLDPETGRIRHFGPADGLAGAIVNDILSDDRGRLWISTNGGISVLDPRTERTASRPPAAYVSRVAISGVELELPESGTRRLGELSLPWPRNTIAFSWVAVGFEAERGLRYETRLEGADSAWSKPSDARQVNYANLGPGRYSFRVRSVSPEGVAAEDAASVSFRILPPFWRRGWFLALVALAIAAAVFGGHELRVRRLMAMERIRRQIATDLHDDMGSGLVEIAVLAEVAKRRADAESAPLLGQAAELARGLRDSMSDIVWAIDPRRDRLADLVQRLRQVAFNLLEAEGVRVAFEAPPTETIERIELPPDRRRHLFLAVKEALANAARHAGASSVTVTMTLAHRRLLLSVADDGRGFEVGTATGGRGLGNLKHRAEALGGAFTVESAPGKGTTVRLDVPLRGDVV
ncbi:MAG TPA: two-component regulator propeller domain-containing protein [Candidatus Polarisedimenticolaceae bacterium]|nr:two-component regulator propeller domain-containing protein [Candidatus Polarisedimenticolaceae bacterium]